MLRHIQAIHTVLCLQQELDELIAWAERKNFTAVAKAYENRLGDIERRLVRYTISQPRLTLLARVHFAVYRLVVPSARYYKRGSAAKFRRANFVTNAGY